MIYDEEIIIIFLNIIHGEFIRLDRLYLISYEVLQIVTRLCMIEEVSMLKSINNVEDNHLIRLISHGRELQIDTIRDVDVMYETMGYLLKSITRT